MCCVLENVSFQPFFSIMLLEGRIEVHVNSGDGTSLRKALLHAPTGSYSDGQEHSISLVRNRRYLAPGPCRDELEEAP
jgi:hypothetical protein